MPPGIGYMAAEMSSPLRMQGAMANSPQTDGNWFQRNGLGSGFSDFAGGLRNITQNFAAGFSKDPARREVAQYGLAQQAEQQQAQKRQIMELTFKNLESLGSVVQANPAILTKPAFQKYIAAQGNNLRALGMPDQFVQETLSGIEMMAQMPPPAGDPFTLGPGDVRYSGTGEEIASVPAASEGAASTLGKLRADLDAGRITPQEYEAAYREMTHIAGPNTTSVSVAQAPPADFRYVYDDAGRVSHMEVIPGSKTAMEVDAQKAASEAGQAQQEMYGDVVVQDVGRSIALIENSPFPVAGMGSLLSAAPGTPQRDLAALLQTIRANVSFERLNQMRQASKTGAALGNVTEKEMASLESVMGNLEQSQSGEQLSTNLRRLRDTWLDLAYGPDRPKVTETPDVPKNEPAPEKEASKLTVQDVDAMTPQQLSRVDVTKITDTKVLQRILELMP